MARRISFFVAAVSLATFMMAAPARACSVCGGDPNSEMVKGALSGVIVMVAVTYGLLFMFVGMLATWFIRARRLAALPVEAKEETAGESQTQ